MKRSYCGLDRISFDQVIVVEVALGRDRRETVTLEQHQSCSCQCKVKVIMMMRGGRPSEKLEFWHERRKSDK